MNRQEGSSMEVETEARTAPTYVDSEDEEPNKVTPCFGRPRNPVGKFIVWYLSWVLPGFGMFSEAYIIFSLGQIKPFQKAMFGDCFSKELGGCKDSLIKNQNYIQICGIIAGMLFWGYVGDLTGRKWGSRIVSAIMLSGCILLTFTPFATADPTKGYQYLVFFIISETWYGFGVGGEYPMASSSAAERAEASVKRRQLRGREVILTFTGQGLGNFTNSFVILICMAIFKQTQKLSFNGSRNVMALQAGVGACCSVFLVWYRFTYLHESEVFQQVVKPKNGAKVYPADVDARDMNDTQTDQWSRHWASLKVYWPRLFVTSGAWIANDFAFYGNKLFQSTFINLLYPGSTQYVQQKWTVLNSFVALCGYFMAAWLVDKRWYGRMHIFQFLYFFSSFWNQFGPNATTWLVAGEVFPTDIRASYHGFNAAMGKVGAIIAGVVFGYVNNRTIFYISALFGIGGAIQTWLFLPNTTGMDLRENDSLQKHIIAGTWNQYHGEAINPKYLSLFERMMGWGKNYDAELDKRQREQEVLADVKAAMGEKA